MRVVKNFPAMLFIATLTLSLPVLLSARTTTASPTWNAAQTTPGDSVNAAKAPSGAGSSTDGTSDPGAVAKIGNPAPATPLSGRCLSHLAPCSLITVP